MYFAGGANGQSTQLHVVAFLPPFHLAMTSETTRIR